MRITISLAAAIALVVAACDGGGGSTGTSGTSSSGGSSSGGSSSGGSSSGGSSSGASQEPAGSAGQEDAYCQAQASHETCNGGTASEPCREDAKCIYGRVMSRTAANAYFTCYSAPSCKSDDDCAGEAGIAAGGDAATKYMNDCIAKGKECPDSFHDDLCSPALFAYPDVRDAALACLAKSCSELEACFGAAIKPISDCKN
jgi:hypothetical protein